MPRRARGGGTGANVVGVHVNPRDWAKFLADLKRFEPETRKELNRELKKLGATMVTAAKTNASWSTRIPGATRLGVTRKGVRLVTSGRRAPHARPYEGFSGASFRHPVFGDRSNWVSQDARPFLGPAAEEHRDEFMEAAGAAVDAAASNTGWKK